MALSIGTEVYASLVSNVRVIGTAYTGDEVSHALADDVGDILWDTRGHQQLEEIWNGIEGTRFQGDRVRQVLEQRPAVQDWRVGEAFAEAYLVHHRDCEFPWPSGRDLKNSAASQAGADLVGFQHMESGPRLAFGEVKTSSQLASPPSVVTGRHGMQRQLEHLRDRPPVKNQLLKYLGFHAQGTSWMQTFQSASARYFGDAADISLFGVVVRDVMPNVADVAGRCPRLARGCPPATSIELVAIYLPAGSIPTLAGEANRARLKKRR